VLDPNGEYRSTFSDVDDVRIFQVVPDEEARASSCAGMDLE
jgi:hypothetical protein